MSIRIAGDLTRIAQQEAFEAAAKVAERESSRLMRKAEKCHSAEPPDYDGYEHLETCATLVQQVADLIRKRAKRAA